MPIRFALWKITNQLREWTGWQVMSSCIILYANYLGRTGDAPAVSHLLIMCQPHLVDVLTLRADFEKGVELDDTNGILSAYSSVEAALAYSQAINRNTNPIQGYIYLTGTNLSLT